MSAVEGLELDRDQLHCYLDTDGDEIPSSETNFSNEHVPLSVKFSADPVAPGEDVVRLDKASLEKALKQYKPLVRKIASVMIQKLPSNVEIDDLVQCGMMGLMQAVERYKPSPNSTFETFAIPRIRGAMYDELRHNDEMSRTHRSVVRKLNTSITRLEHKLGRKPTISELSESMGISTEECGSMMSEMSYGNAVSLESMALYDDSLDHISSLGSLASEPSAVLEPLQADDLLSRAIEQLDDREKLVIVEHFHNNKRMMDIAAEMGVSSSRVSQLLSKAIHDLRMKVLKLESPGLTKKANAFRLCASAARTAQLKKERENIELEKELASKMRERAKPPGAQPDAWKRRDKNLDERLGPLTPDMLDIVRW